MAARAFGLRACLLAATLVACSGDDQPAPRNVTKQEAHDKEARKDLNRARRMVKARKDNVRGGVELAAFAQELQRLTVAGAREEIEALFLDPEAISSCTFSRDKGAQIVEFERVREFVTQRRSRLDGIVPLSDATVVALVHRVRPRKRIMGARVHGDGCPVEARGRLNVVVQPAAPPPDVIEHQFEAAFVNDRWWLIAFEKNERDCSDLGAPEAFGCRALRGVE